MSVLKLSGIQKSFQIVCKTEKQDIYICSIMSFDLGKKENIF